MNFVRHIESYAHAGRIGVLVECGLDTEFAATATPFTQFARDVVLPVAATGPASVQDLLQQPFVKDASRTVGQLLSGIAGLLREPITIVRFVRWDTDPSHWASPEPPQAPATVVRLGRRGDP